MDHASVDLGSMRKNPSDLYSKPMKVIDYRSSDYIVDYSRTSSTYQSEGRPDINHGQETVSSKANLAISDQLYTEPEIFPGNGNKQIESFQASARRKRLAVGFGITGGVVFVGLVVGLTGWLVTRATAPPPTLPPIEQTTEPILSEENLLRIDCIPEGEGGVANVTKEICEGRGCVWWPRPMFERLPPCFFPLGDDFGYKVIGTEGTALGQRWFLERLTSNGVYGINFQFITFEMEMRDDNTLRFKFDTTIDNSRYKVPISLNLGDVKARNPSYLLDVYSEEPFAFKVIRKSTGTALFDTGGNGLVFTDQFIQISTRLPSSNLYGLGENLHKSFRHDLEWKTWPMFSRDQPPFSGDDSLDFNLYSVHPFYEVLEDDGQAHGVFLLNSNAMDYSLTPLPMLVLKTIGGILDFYMFLGPNPETVIQQYTAAVGRPYMPPYWSLGFQLARYGYHNLSEMQDAVSRTLEYNIPLDVQYADIDYMDNQRDFTLDPVIWGGLPQYFEEIRAEGINTIVILDPPFEINDTYEPYIKGRDINGYVSWPDIDSMPEGDYSEHNRTDMMGYVWPTWKVVFPDFFNNNMVKLWGELVVKLRELIPFDGLWLDMNEPANFDTNNEKAWNWPEDRLPYWTLKCPESQWDDPPFRTKASYMYDNVEANTMDRLSGKTLCMVGVHTGGYKHYDVHSLYGHKQTQASLGPVREAVGGNKRSLIVTRSTYAGDGAISGRWLGDNSATWTDMKLSIIGMLESNLFGIPYIGADICGFFGSPSPQLCMRWHELGAFYPYSRNHNHEDPPHQDPGAFGGGVALAARNALNIRYTLLPYLYTLFHRAHTKGNTVVRPLFHEFGTDQNTWGIDEQFLWGPALLITPILVEIDLEEEEETADMQFYVPRGRWYNYYTRINATEFGKETKALSVEMETPIQLHVRGGYIIPTQEAANNTKFSRQNTFGLLVALDEVDGYADGDLFWDDGQSIDTYENGNYHYAYFKASERRLKMNIQYSSGVPELSDLYLDKVEIMGVSKAGIVYINDEQFDSFIFDADKQLLYISGIKHSMKDDMEIVWRDKRYPTEAESLRVDCCPEGCVGFECVAKDCLWNPVGDVDGVPACYINPNNFGYKLMTVGVSSYTLEWRGTGSIFRNDIKDISISASSHKSVYRIKIFDPNVNRYEVPLPIRVSGGSGSFEYEFNTQPFGFRLGRAGTTMEMLDTYAMNGIVFTDKYIQLSSRLASKNVYGVGEHLKSSFKHDLDYKTWPMFSRDQPPTEGANLHGVHPYIMVIESNNRAHGIFFRNSNAQELQFHPTPGFTYRTTGGVLDMFVVIGNNPEQVMQQYLGVIGNPFLPPYWSLGFHLSRSGFTHIDEMQAAIERNKAAGIPMDTIHTDIDFFDERKIFTIDRANFSAMADFMEVIRNQSMKIIMLMNPVLITNETGYRPYDLGLARNVFVKFPAGENPDYDIYGNDNLLGWVWPKGRVVFFDYFNRQGATLWKDLITEYHKDIEFDGVWLDMNEPTNFGTNQDRPFNWPEEDVPYWSLKCPKTEWDDPTYKPRSILGDRLSDKTICMSTVYNNGRSRHYDVHSVYGWSQTVPTLEAMQAITSKRSLVLTRSTFAGVGVHAGHWLGDNASVWKAMKQSIIGILDFNMFGIPYVGADICGYFGDAEPEMCERWHQLGAFYPFARNHNAASATNQDPAAMGVVVASSTRKVMELRYSLIPYLYTLFFKAHTSGSTVVRPLVNLFVSNRETLDIDEQFMWGPALLITPVIRPDKSEVFGYIPTGRWFDFYTGIEETKTQQVVPMHAPHDHIPLHVRGGYIIPMQGSGLSTKVSRNTPFTLLVAMDTRQRASGDLFWDDGEGIDTVKKEVFCEISLSLVSNNVSFTRVGDAESDDLDGHVLNTIRVLGMDKEPSDFFSSPDAAGLTYVYSPKKKELYIDNLGFDLSKDFAVWWT